MSNRKEVWANIIFGALLTTGLIALASGQTTAPSEQEDVGVLDNPCGALAPMPSSMTTYLANRARAEAAKEPPPAPNAEDTRAFETWQAKRLAQDFGGLCRYEAANAALPPPTSHRVIYYGDSITELWANRDPSLFVDDVIDRGISGQTSAQMVLRFRSDVIELKPKVVHILAGTNDVAGNTGPTTLARIEGNLSTMVELAQSHHISVVLGSVLPAAKFTWRAGVNPVEPIRKLNGWIRLYAAEHKIPYADYYDAMKDEHAALQDTLGDDGVHPNAQGYAVMRPIAVKAVKQALVPR